MNERPPIIAFRNVTKRFGKTTALDNVTLDIRPGSIVGLLGDNGAGKSTLLRHIVGLYLPDDGECTTFDCPVQDLRAEHLARIGYVHQNGEPLDWMTVRQFIRYVSSYYDAWNAELEKKFVRDFDVPVKSRVGALSPGQAQRLAVLVAIAFEPELLILDEPASGLDPIARGRFLDLLMELIQDDRRTIIMSSHILSDVEKVIDHVIIMKAGRIVLDRPFDAFQEAYCRLTVTSPHGALPQTLPFEGAIETRRSAHSAVIVAPTPKNGEIERFEREAGCRVERKSLSLDELYRVVVEGKVREEEASCR